MMKRLSLAILTFLSFQFASQALASSPLDRLYARSDSLDQLSRRDATIAFIHAAKKASAKAMNDWFQENYGYLGQKNIVISQARELRFDVIPGGGFNGATIAVGLYRLNGEIRLLDSRRVVHFTIWLTDNDGSGATLFQVSQDTSEKRAPYQVIPPIYDEDSVVRTGLTVSGIAVPNEDEDGTLEISSYALLDFVEAELPPFKKQKIRLYVRSIPNHEYKTKDEKFLDYVRKRDAAAQFRNNCEWYISSPDSIFISKNSIPQGATRSIVLIGEDGNPIEVKRGVPIDYSLAYLTYGSPNPQVEFSFIDAATLSKYADIRKYHVIRLTTCQAFARSMVDFREAAGGWSYYKAFMERARSNVGDAFSGTDVYN